MYGVPTLALILAASFGLVATAAAQDRAPTVVESVGDGMEVVDPLAFQTTAAAWITFQLRSAELALERSQTNSVRQLASTIVDQYASVIPGLSVAAEADELPTAPVEGLDGRQFGMMGKLEAAPDSEFDRLFLDMQVASHEESIGLFEGFSSNGEGQLRTFAQSNLPLLVGSLAQISALSAGNSQPSRPE